MFLRKVFLFATLNAIIAATTFVSAQRQPYTNPDFGPDSLSRIQCANNLSTMGEYMKINLPDYALPAWRYTFENCPAASKNIYINGAKIFQDKIESSKDTEFIAACLDTLMLIYERRMKYFGEEGYVLGRMGKDILRYNSKEYAKAYAVLKKSFELTGDDVDATVAVGLFESGVLLYRDGAIPAQELLNTYLEISEFTESQEKGGRRSSVNEMIKKRVNEALARAGLNDCGEIQTAFSAKVESSAGDPVFLSLVSDILQKSDCINTEFFGAVNEKLFAVEPTSDLAYMLAWYNIRKERFEPAISYLNQAISLDSDPDKQSHYYYQMAIICNTKMNKQQDAVKYAEKAVELLPAWGEPYFVLANAYLQAAKDCFDGAFERATVYWVATDMCNKAKSVDKEVVDKANGYISDYEKYYPNTEEVFFRSLQEGNSYQVGCWINKPTTVRVKK